MKTGKKLMIAAALLLAVLLALGGCFNISVFSEDSAAVPADKKLPQPLLYEKDGEVFMANGADAISLGKAEELYSDRALNAVFSGDNSSLFYVKYDGQQGSGTLMKLKTDLSGAPAPIADGVSAAQVSNDGEDVLYITGINDITGDLYLKKAAAAPQLIANNVLPIDYGFSQQGGSIYYFTLKDSDTLALYVKKDGSAPELVAEHEGTPYIQYGVCLDNVGALAADEEGRLLYSFMDNYMSEKLCLYSDGASETLCEQGSAVKTFGALDDLLYAESNNFTGAASLWYKDKGKKAVKIADNASVIFYGEDYYYGGYYYGATDIIGSDNDRRFIVSESTGDYDSNFILYEQELGKGKQVISVTDGYSPVTLSPARNCVVYGRGGKTYIARKIQGEWVESEFTALQDVLSDSFFDPSGKYFYYISASGGSPGTLCRYSVTDGSTEELGKDVYTLSLCGDTLYAMSEDGTAYRVEGTGMVKIGQKAGYITEACGGVFLEYYPDEYNDAEYTSVVDIQFVADGEDSARSICSGATELYAYSIDYYPPIEKDPYSALDQLLGSAYYYQAQLNGEDYGEEPSIDLKKAIELSGLFPETPGDDDYTAGLLAMLNEGFENYRLWQNEAPGDKKELYRLTALLKLGDVIDEYDSGDEEGD